MVKRTRKSQDVVAPVIIAFHQNYDLILEQGNAIGATLSGFTNVGFSAINRSVTFIPLNRRRYTFGVSDAGK